MKFKESINVIKIMIEICRFLNKILNKWRVKEWHFYMSKLKQDKQNLNK